MSWSINVGEPSPIPKSSDIEDLGPKTRLTDFGADKNYLSSHEVGGTDTIELPPADWIASSDFSTLSGWPQDDPIETCLASSVFSPEIYSLSIEGSWAFDDSLQKATIQTPTPLFRPGGEIPGASVHPQSGPDWTRTGDSPPGSYLNLTDSSVPHLLINGALASSNKYNDEDNQTSASANTSHSPEIELNETSHKKIRDSPSVTSKEIRRTIGNGTAKPTRHSTRNKHKTQMPLSEYSGSLSPSAAHLLRCNKPGSKVTYSEENSSAISEHAKSSRLSHSLVEKQYRSRLNGQFSTLLRCIPQDVVRAECEGWGRGEDGHEKRISKAEVLFLAKRHIETLEWANISLQNDKIALMEDVARLKTLGVGRDGRER